MSPSDGRPATEGRKTGSAGRIIGLKIVSEKLQRDQLVYKRSHDSMKDKRARQLI